MKLRLTLLSALFAAGVFASFALAEGGGHAAKADGNDCHEVHISGTIAPQTLAVTVGKASEKSAIAAGAVVNLAVGSAGQTVKVNVQACSTGTGTALQYSVRQIELQVRTPHVETTQAGTTTTATTTHGDDHGNGGEHHKGGTTTTATTTAATTTTNHSTTTVGTTTTTP